MMLENWMGEILLIILLVFLICPRDIPKIMHFIGKTIGSLKKYREKARDLQRELIEELDVEGLRDDVYRLRRGMDDLRKSMNEPVKASMTKTSRSRPQIRKPRKK
jgi:Sec-independent protein translocase protein TatA